MLFFIYGTLKKNFYNHHILQNLNIDRPLSKVTTVEKYPLFVLKDPFPYLQNNKGEGFNVIGELYEIPEECLSILDNFEGVPYLYKRGVLDVVDVEGNISKNVNVYFKSQKINLNKIECVSEYLFHN